MSNTHCVHGTFIEGYGWSAAVPCYYCENGISVEDKEIRLLALRREDAWLAFENCVFWYHEETVEYFAALLPILRRLNAPRVPADSAFWQIAG